MAKLQIPLPEQLPFSTQLTVLIQHINRANHLANEHLIALLNEARSRYMQQLEQQHPAFHAQNFINADLAIVYQSEAHHGDVLCIDVGAQDFSRYGCDIVYRVTQASNAKPVAIAKMAMLQFDYTQQQLTPTPANFSQWFEI